MSCGMALITIRAVVDVTLYALMLLVGLALSMTIGAGEHRIVIWIGMTVTTGSGTAMVHGEPRVIEGCPLP